LNKQTEQYEKLLLDCIEGLRARVTESHGLSNDVLLGRVRSVVEKYILRDHPDASASEIREFVDKLQADDLCLIVACEQGDQNAWSELVERFSPTVRSAARSASSNEEGADDLAQSIWAELHGLRVRQDGKPAGKLGYYSGRGSLAGWLRAVVGQLAIDQHRKQSRLVQTEEDSDFDRIIQHGEDDHNWASTHEVINPETEVTDKQTAAEVQKALSSAMQKLSAEDRLLVKLYYFDGLRLREAGTVLGVHEATASRRLTRIHTELRDNVERMLIEDKGWTKSETARAFSGVALHFEADIEPMVANEGVLLKKENEIAR
jgi:RNA polymerase sigma-70 factor (ECF subfamily)